MIDLNGKTLALCVLDAEGKVEKKAGFKVRWSPDAAQALKKNFPEVQLEDSLFAVMVGTVLLESAAALRELLEVPLDKELPEDVMRQRMDLAQQLTLLV